MEFAVALIAWDYIIIQVLVKYRAEHIVGFILKSMAFAVVSDLVE